MPQDQNFDSDPENRCENFKTGSFVENKQKFIKLNKIGKIRENRKNIHSDKAIKSQILPNQKFVITHNFESPREIGGGSHSIISFENKIEKYKQKLV